MVVKELGCEVPAYSVLGTKRARLNPGTVTHVAILPESSIPEAGEACVVWHCGPPVVKSSYHFHIAGHLESLTGTEASILRTVGPTIIREMEAADVSKKEQYVIRPPQHVEVDPITSRVKHQRYSCAGFVMACYQFADIELVDTDENHLPQVSFKILGEHNPYVHRLSESQRADFGIPGDGPWPIVLAGYVVRSFDRPDNEIRSAPYRVTAISDGDFPTQDS